MILQDSKTTLVKPIKIPEGLTGKVTLLANCDLEPNEVDLFNAGLKAMAEYIRDNHIDLSDYSSFNVFFTYNGTLTLLEDRETNCGSQFHVAIYRMEKLRQLNSHKMMAFVFVEELAHYFLRISDETAIKYKVTEILNYFWPDFKIEEAKGWGLNGLS